MKKDWEDVKIMLQSSVKIKPLRQFLLLPRRDIHRHYCEIQNELMHESCKPSYYFIAYVCSSHHYCSQSSETILLTFNRYIELAVLLTNLRAK